MMISLRPARPEEAASLTKLCLRSKAIWGYTGEFMYACRAELTVTAERITASPVEVAEINERVVGIAELEVRESVAQLAKLCVEPDVLRSGVGRSLFMWAKTAARQFGAAVLTIDADPNAADFYRCLGATDDGLAPSGSIPGRVIPRLRVTL